MITLRQYTERILQLPGRIAQDLPSTVIVPAANELLARIKNRIVLEGQDSNGNKIGTYSTKPAYYSREQFDRRSSFSARGKNSRNDFSNGRQRKTMYMPSGYKQLRDLQGKPNDKMYLDYSGSTMLAYQQSLNEKEVLQGMTTKLASDIRQGHEGRLSKPIYRATKSELEQYNKNVAIGLAELNVKILSGVSG